jgi:tetratricopeptide (TPR) repeat protein
MGFVLVALGAVGFLPLFGGPGYEHSLASGLIVPPAAAVSVALELSTGPALPPLTCVVRGLIRGGALSAAAFLTALAHGARVGICDLGGASLLFLLTAGIGGSVGGLWGALVAEIVRGWRGRRLGCVLLGLAGPLAGIVASLIRFWTSPMIFAFDPFFGYFSGSLYDTVVEVRTSLWTYRGGSLAVLVGTALVASALERTPRGGVSARGLGEDRAALARFSAGVVALLVALGVTVEGARLGHWQTAGSVARALGARASGPTCEVLYPDSLLPEQGALLLRDCEQEVRAVQAKLGASLDGRLTAYHFRDAAQKRELTGAGDVSIAKPWRREVYVQVAGYPHPILGHETAHVVAGSFAPGPFRVAGGWWPNPGLIEGLAVAASPEPDELSGRQWARAMLDLDILPSTRSLFSLGFLGESADRSYTVAGAFVAWILEAKGASVVRSWYGGASLSDLLGEPWEQIDTEFRAWLRAAPLPPDALAYASSRFRRPAVWSRKCPHAVDAMNRAADGCRDEHRFAQASHLYGQALERDPDDWHAILDRSRIDLRGPDAPAGRALLRELVADDRAPRQWRDRAEEALADDDVLAGRIEQAIDAYRSIASRTPDEDFGRTLEVKALGLEGGKSRQAIVDLLIGTRSRPLDPWIGALSLGLWAGSTPDPLAAYLAGKNLAGHEDWEAAAAWLDVALEAPAATPRIGRELLKQRAICACVLGDRVAVERARAAIGATGSPFGEGQGGRREWLLALLDRCL